MDLANTLLVICRDTSLIAWRPGGAIIRMTDHQRILVTLREREYRWQPVFGDLIAQDWQCGTVQQLQQMIERANRETEQG
jgi:hypothetical protein